MMVYFSGPDLLKSAGKERAVELYRFIGMLIIIRKIKEAFHILRNIQQEQKQVQGRINISLDIVITKQERLIKH